MSKVIAQVNAAADTFQVFIERTNDVINAISTEVVTANSEANGSLTTGNAYVNGIFSSLTLTANTLRGGNVQSLANLNITTNTIFSGSFISVNDKEIATVNSQTSGTSGQIIDSFSITSWRGGEYVLTVKDNGANGYQISRVLVLHDGGDAHTTEYGIVYSNTQLANFSANANATHIRLVATPTIANSQIKASRTLVKV